MVRCGLLIILTLAVVLPPKPVSAGSSPATDWALAIGSPGDDRWNDLATDSQGNVLVTGSFYDTVDFGGGGLVSAGSADVFLAKYDRDGAMLWAQRFGGVTGDSGVGVATDAADNVLLSGYFLTSINLGGATFTGVGDEDIFIAKFDPNGVHLWSKQFGNNEYASGLDLACDAAQNVIVTGFFRESLDFGGGSLVSVDDADIFIAKFSTDGAHLWSAAYGGLRSDVGRSLAVQPDGTIWLAGEFGVEVNFGGGDLTSAGSIDGFLAKFGPDGSHLWSQGFGGSSVDRCRGVAIDGAGNVHVTGEFNVTIDFGGGPLVSSANLDGFLAKFDSAGTHQWSQSFGSSGNDAGLGIDVSPAGTVAVTGLFQAPVSFGGDPVQGGASFDAFLAVYDPDGTHRWSTGWGADGLDRGSQVGFDPYGKILVTGYFGETVDFGFGPQTSNGSYDGFLLKVQPNAAEPLIRSIRDVGNDQGRRVTISFDRSGYDEVDSGLPIQTYEVYRRDDTPPMSAKLEGWTYVGSAPAHGEEEYAIEATTIGDSTLSQGPYESAFMIRATTGSPAVFHDSATGLGHSLDNLAPGMPENLAVNGNVLSWDESEAPDFDYYTVYGANAMDFGTAVIVDQTVDPDLDVTASGYAYHFVTALDHAGNESAPALLESVSAAGNTPGRYILSVTNHPNPFNPQTAIKYTVPTPGRVTIAIYDVRGARVATLLEGAEHEPGPYAVVWDGGRGISGVYFARIAFKGEVKTRKMLLLE